MIKVNLITDHTYRARKVAVRPSVSRIGLIFAAVLLLTLASLAGFWYMLDREVGTLTSTRDRLKVESARLQELKKKLVEYEKLKSLRQSRIDVIERLKDSQTGPVLLLNGVIKSIPRNGELWLTTVDQKGDRIQIAGMAVRSDVLPDFMSNLAATGLFKSVELEVLQEDKETTAKFSLVCTTARKTQPQPQAE
jgi:Tfp pilus assembly protein PilN